MTRHDTLYCIASHRIVADRCGLKKSVSDNIRDG